MSSVSPTPCVINDTHVHEYHFDGEVQRIQFRNCKQCEVYTCMLTNLREHCKFVDDVPSDRNCPGFQVYRDFAYSWLARAGLFQERHGATCVPPDIRALQHTIEVSLYGEPNPISPPFGTVVCPEWSDFGFEPTVGDWLYSSDEELFSHSSDAESS